MPPEKTKDVPTVTGTPAKPDAPAAPKTDKLVPSNKSKELKPAPQDVLDKANEAVKNGADINEVLKRLKDNGYNVQVIDKKK